MTSSTGGEPQATPQSTVFINYYKENASYAQRLYLDLKAANLNPWIDKENLLPGQHKRIQTEKAICGCNYFVSLLSRTSVKDRGNVTSEIKKALAVFGNIPGSTPIYFIPTRLDDCDIPYHELSEIQSVDMFPNWEEGLRKILKAMNVSPEQIDLVIKHQHNNSPFTSLDVSPKTSQTQKFKREKSFYVGRDEEFNIKIIDKLKARNSRVSIFGPAGSGKSQLAFKAIRKSIEQGIFDLVIPIYLESGVISLETFLSEMAEKLGVKSKEFEKGGTSIQQRKNRIKELLLRKNHPLVYLDQYDSISSTFLKRGGEGRISEEIQKQTISDTNKKKNDHDALKIHHLIDNNFHTHNTSILLTSRNRSNNLANEQPIELPSLNMEERTILFNEYVKDLHLKNPEGTVKKQVNLLLERTGGHPLSIEIIAKNVRNLKEIEELSESLGLPSENSDEQKIQFETLESCIEYTIGKLDENLQYLLYKLLFFKSPFPISAPVEIIEAAERNILDLYDSGLLTLIQSDEVYGIIHDSQYWLYSFDRAARNYLESTVSTFNDNVTSNIDDALSERFSRYYCNLLSDTCNSIEKENYRSSLARFNIIYRDNDNDFERAMKITTNKQLSADISSNLGHAVTQLGMLSKALEYHTRSFDIYKDIDYKYGMSKEYGRKGVVLMDMGRLVDALEYHKKALEIDEELDHRAGMTRDYTNIGNALEKMGRLVDALEYHKKALEIDEELDDRAGMTRDYTNIGNALEKMDRLVDALEYHKKALEIDEELDDRAGMTRDYKKIGITLWSMGKLDEALKYHEKALQIDENELNDRIGMANDYYNMNFVHADAGNKQEAFICLTKALERLEEFRTETNYHDPLIEYVNKQISHLNRSLA